MPNGNVFDVDAARKAGVSDAQMQQFLQANPHLIRSDDPLFTGKGMIGRAQGQAQQRLADIIRQGPESQGQEMMAHIGGHESAPLNEQEALQQLEDTTKRYAGGEAALYGMGIGGGSTVGQQMLRGAMAGASVRAGTDLWEGNTPKLGRTLKAAAGGALLNPVAEYYLPMIGGIKGKLLRAVLGRGAEEAPAAAKAVRPFAGSAENEFIDMLNNLEPGKANPALRTGETAQEALDRQSQAQAQRMWEQNQPRQPQFGEGGQSTSPRQLPMRPTRVGAPTGTGPTTYSGSKLIKFVKDFRSTPEEVAAAAEPKAAAVVDAQAPQGDVESRARAAGLWTPRSSAQETGMWHAGQGEAPNPAVQTPENTRLFEKIRRGEGMPTPRTESPSYPTARPAAPAYKQGEGTSAVNLVEGEAPRVNPQQQAQSEAWDRQRLADIIRNPKATPEEIAYAKTALGGGGATGSW